MDNTIKLLFVDDDEEFLHFMTSRLEKKGLDVSPHATGEDALKKDEQKVGFDVALLDLDLPCMDGDELLIKLKKRHPFLEVIMLTGHGSIESAARCTREGAYEYLLKPCGIEEVMKAITNAYSKRVKAKSKHKIEMVNKLMDKAIGYSPIEILEELQKLDEE